MATTMAMIVVCHFELSLENFSSHTICKNISILNQPPFGTEAGKIKICDGYTSKMASAQGKWETVVSKKKGPVSKSDVRKAKQSFLDNATNLKAEFKSR